MSRKGQAKFLRITRRVHKVAGICLFIFVIAIGATGLLLGWKKNSNGYLLAETMQGLNRNSGSWISLDSIQKIALNYFVQKNRTPNIEIDRMDVRPGRGIIKVSFVGVYEGIQIDLTTGKVLSEEVRRADFIEHLHDGSYFDSLFGWDSGIFKLVYTSIMGLSLILFSVTGFWLWYGPKRMRK
ncbi:MAG: PepSY domain-containing protein [Flavitalea sp.]